MPFTKDDVSLFKQVNNTQIQLSDAERQAIADEWNANEELLRIENLPDTLATNDIDSISTKDRLLFEINFQQENRIRVLEGKTPITRAQYRDALIAAWKTLNT